MGRVTAVGLVILMVGTVAVSRQARQATTAADARAEASRAIDESSAKLAELTAINAKIVQANAEMSKIYSALSKKVGEVGKTANARGRTPAQLAEAVQQLEEMSQSFNLQYLTLQQQMQDENRRFTLVSNVMKTKHDTAKNAINNVR